MERAIVQRVKAIFKEKGVTMNSFSNGDSAMQARLSRQISGNSEVTFQTISSILERYDDVSADWLLKGEGNMFKSVINNDNQLKQPYYDSDFLLGFTEVLENSAITPEKYIYTTVGDKDCFWCSASGHSMEPEIWGGDKVCMKKIVLEPNCFEFGKIYGIVTKSGIRTIKYVRRANDDEHIRLVPRNHDSVYGDYQDIHLSDVLQVFKVIATMRALY